LPAGAVAGFAPGAQAFLSAIATLPAVEQQDAPSPPLPAQQDDLPSAIVEHAPSLPPQQPFSPGLVEHFIPAAEHLQPSFVPPVSAVATSVAGTVFVSALGVVVEDVVFAALFAFVALVVFVVLVVEPPQPARPSTITAKSEANLIFIENLLLVSR
jgi:hypothetical protein